MVTQATKCVLQPRPIAFAAGNAASSAEPIKRVVGEQVWRERLVPHRIRNHYVMGANLAVRFAEFGVNHGVAPRKLNVHVVNDGIHLGHGVAFGLQFLA